MSSSLDLSLHYQLMFIENKAVMLLINPNDGAIIDASIGACQYYGYSRAELTSMNIFGINSMTRSEIAAEMQRAREETKNHFNFRHRLASGEIRDVEVYSNPIPIEGENYLYSVIHDVTDQKRAEEQYRRLFERTGTGMALLEADGTLSLVNRTFAKLAEADEKKIIGTSFLQWIAEGDRARMKENHLRRLHGEDVPENYEFQFKSLRGREGWALLNLTFFPDSRKTLASVIDITAHKQAEKALLEAVASRDAILAAIPDPMFELDGDGRYLHLWAQKSDESVYSKQTLLGNTVFEILPADAANQVMAALKEADEKGWSHDRQIQVTTPEEELWFELSTSLKDGDSSPNRFVMLSRNITNRKKMEAELRYLSNHDSLTGLLNRRALEEQLNEELHRAERYHHVLSIFMLDIDRFKSINDTLGHQVGDAVLSRLAGVLESSIRVTDYVSRYGGEEFVIILPETPKAKAEELAERLRIRVAEHSIPIEDNKALNITVSIGVSTFPGHGSSRDDLLNAADSAMYDAKSSGRNCVKSEK
ncbi:MAG: diguanylate cyclase [Sedimenticola sp.]